MIATGASDQELGAMRTSAQVTGHAEDTEKRGIEGEGEAFEIRSPSQQSDNEANRIKAFAADIRDQDELERNIGLQVYRQLMHRWRICSTNVICT